jgi:hypothetical protein
MLLITSLHRLLQCYQCLIKSKQNTHIISKQNLRYNPEHSKAFVKHIFILRHKPTRIARTLKQSGT